jgi:hypothetical protein
VWCTSDPELANGTDDDPVYRTFDGQRWGPILTLVPDDDRGEDVQPAVASTADGVLVAWTTSSPLLSHGPDQDIVSRLIGPEGLGKIVQVSPVGDSDNDFLPRLAHTPQGTYAVWHTRTLREVPDSRGTENALVLQGRLLWGSLWRELVEVSGNLGGENVWVDMMWDGSRLSMVWQNGGTALAFDSRSILYREWGLEGLSPIQDISTPLGRANNGRPSMVKTDGTVRVISHTNDDGITVSESYDLVMRDREEGDRWSPIEVYQADPDRNLLQVDTSPHGGGEYAAWITNVTYDMATPVGAVQVWDVVVAPISLPPDPTRDIVVTPRWVRSMEAWGPEDRIVFLVEKGGQPRGDSLLSVMVMDPEGEVETILDGTTDGSGQVTFDHVLRSVGDYSLVVTLDGTEMGALGIRVAPPPEYMGSLVVTLLVLLAFVAILVLAGYRYISDRGTVDPKAQNANPPPPRRASLFWRWISRALTRVVRSARLQGYLQIPLFALLVISIFLGYMGTQDPQANFTTMVGWVYYLPGMLILYAFFGRLWCYVEACGFIDTWAKRLFKQRKWLEWPRWLQNLWPAFFLLLAGFWVEIVFSIDLYPWAVATFMLVVLLINFTISVNFGKRTYCRFMCRDGVIEELIARFSILKIGVETRADSVSRGGACIWKESEKRPGYCSMCFTCLQNNPDVKEASVIPQIRTYGQDVYRPRKIHSDEAVAALLLMGISIPYMAVLTRAWWVDLTDIAFAWSLPAGTLAQLAAGFGAVVVVALIDRWAFAGPAASFTPVRKALVVTLEVLLLGLYFIAVLGGDVGRLILLRSLFVMGCFMLPLGLAWLGGRLVVWVTRDHRKETPGKLMDRYALVFIPVFVGVLIARNIPIVGMWGWGVIDIVKATFAQFPGGTATVIPQPFVDPSLHFALGIAALAFGLALGAYTALQISRHIYADRKHAFNAFTVQSAMLTVLVGLFVVIMALPRF